MADGGYEDGSEEEGGGEEAGREEEGPCEEGRKAREEVVLPVVADSGVDPNSVYLISAGVAALCKKAVSGIVGKENTLDLRTQIRDQVSDAMKPDSIEIVPAYHDADENMRAVREVNEDVPDGFMVRITKTLPVVMDSIFIKLDMEDD